MAVISLSLGIVTLLFFGFVWVAGPIFSSLIYFLTNVVLIVLAKKDKEYPKLAIAAIVINTISAAINGFFAFGYYYSIFK